MEVKQQHIEVKQKYIDVIEDQNYLLDFQKMVLDISFKFMNINQENFDERVNYLLKRIGTFFNVDRTYLFTVNNDKQSMYYSHEWSNTGTLMEKEKRKKIPMNTFPWWLEQLDKKKLVYVSDITQMPIEAEAEKKQLQDQGIKSSISVPVINKGKMEAFIGIDSTKSISEKKWSTENIKLLHAMARILSKGIVEINDDKKIDFMAYYDPLTKLPNQSLLVERLKKGIKLAHHQKNPIGIFFIDLDGFKSINDALGHKQGDQLLKLVADRLVEAVEKTDTVCRRGGDEFIIYLNNYNDEKDLENTAERILDLFKKPFILKDQEYFITASIGISEYPVDGEDIPTLIGNADMAMYQAKKIGKNRFIKCSEQLKKETSENILLTSELYYAIERDELELHYQPQVKGVTGEIVGVESLLRWKHPKLGFVPPFKFIPLAEKTRLILSIGEWVLETACKQWVEWQKKGYKPIKISVNFSGHQLNHPDIVEQIKITLAETSMPAEYLEIEITESVAMDDCNKVVKRLKQIREMGISLSIDDYGKEYSSLNRLKESPVDAMKIDMSFIQGIGINPKDEIIVKALLSLASNLGIYTVAEGVETEEQLNFLSETCCVLLQGYYFYKPMPVDEMEKVLTPLN